MSSYPVQTKITCLAAGSSIQKDDIYIPSGKRLQKTNWNITVFNGFRKTISMAIFQFAFRMFTRPDRVWSHWVHPNCNWTKPKETLPIHPRWTKPRKAIASVNHQVSRAPQLTQLLMYPILLVGLVVIYPMISLRWLVINSYLLVSFTVRKYPTYCPRFCPPVIKRANGKSSICKWFAHWNLYPSIMWLGNSK